jgi:50S ribosomal protein L16 3-hydroxylase
VDRYDVFLVQAQGKRRWHVGNRRSNEKLRADTELKVLAEFEPEESFVAEPGDVLYLPPGVAHYGIAEDDCLTYSFGFRAPEYQDLMRTLLDNLPADDTRIELLNEAGAVSHAELGPALLTQVRDELGRRLAAAANNPDLLGGYLTEAKPNIVVPRPDEPLDPPSILRELESGRALVRDPAARFLYASPTPEQTRLFAHGGRVNLGEFEAPRLLAQSLTEARTLGKGALAPWLRGADRDALSELLANLYEEGLLKFADEV